MIYEYAATILQGEKIRLTKPSEISQACRGHRDCFNLLQASSQIRAEFSSLYYKNTHFAIDNKQARRYCTELRQNGTPVSNLTVLIEPGNASAGSRRSSMRVRGLIVRDFLPVMEMNMKHFPDCTIEIATWDAVSSTFAPTPAQTALNCLLKGNEVFREDIRRRKVSQVLISDVSNGECKIRLVYKVPYEQPWMRRMLSTASEAEAYAKTLGLINEAPMNRTQYDSWISFGVKY